MRVAVAQLAFADDLSGVVDALDIGEAQRRGGGEGVSEVDRYCVPQRMAVALPRQSVELSRSSFRSVARAPLPHGLPGNGRK